MNKIKRAINKLDDILASAGNAKVDLNWNKQREHMTMQKAEIESAVEKFIQQREGKPKIQEF